jgi:hypothetical protein
LLQRSNLLVVVVKTYFTAHSDGHSHCVQQISDKLARLVKLRLPRFRPLCLNLRNRRDARRLGGIRDIPYRRVDG